MRTLLGSVLAAMILAASSLSATAQDLVFMLDNQSGYNIMYFYASPTDVGNWEDDILGADILASGESARITIADGRAQCDYDLRIVFEDGDEIYDTVDLCETGSYTVTD